MDGSLTNESAAIWYAGAVGAIEMKGPFEQVHAGLCYIPRLERNMIIRDGLERAAKDVPELEELRRETCPAELGRLGMRNLAFTLCLWGERAGVLDDVFPLAAVKESEER